MPQTEWHNYKSGRTGRVAGAYFYLPERSDDNLAHIYQPPGASGWYAQCFLRGAPVPSGYIAASLDDAKRRVAAMIISFVDGQKDLFVTPQF